MKNGFVVLLLSLLLVVTGDIYAESTKANKEDIKLICATLCKDEGRTLPGEGSQYSMPDQGYAKNYDDNVHVQRSFLDLSFVYWIYYLAYSVVTFLIAVLIYKHAKTRNELALNLSPFVWGAIVFVNPALGVLAYWVMNVMDVSKLLGRNDVQA